MLIVNAHCGVDHWMCDGRFACLALVWLAENRKNKSGGESQREKESERETGRQKNGREADEH